MIDETVYLTPAEFVTRVGEAKALQLINADPDADPPIDPADNALLIASVDDAVGTVRSFVLRRYNREIVSPVPSEIKRACLNIAKWYIISASRIDVGMETDKDAYDQAIEWLDKLVKGGVELNVQEADEKPLIAGPRVAEIGSNVTDRQETANYKQQWFKDW